MKKLLAGLLFAALLAPDSAMATYSCFGTRSPCPFTTISAAPLAAEPVKAQKTKKTKKKAKKKSTKKAVAKKAPVYCEPAPTDMKAGTTPAPTMTPAPEPVAPVAVPAPVEAAPAPVPDTIKAPEPEKTVTPPVDGEKTEPKLDVLPLPVPEKKSEAVPEPVKDGSILDTLNTLDVKPAGLPPADAAVAPDLIKPVEAPKPVPDTGFPEINAPAVPSAPEPTPALQAPAPTVAPVEAMPAGPMQP